MAQDNGKQRKVDAFLKALQTARPNRKLVEEAFREHLRLLGPNWKRRIKFYRNLRAACLSDTRHTGAYTHRLDTTWSREWSRERGGRRYEYRDQPPLYSGMGSKTDAVNSMVAALDGANQLAWNAVNMQLSDITAWSQAWRAAKIQRPNPFDPFIKILQGGCLIYWVGRVAVHIVLATVHVQGDRVHREDGPAVQYEDGSGAWCWNGALLPKKFVLHPERITPRKILAEPNAETRRAMIERYGGMTKFVCDSKAKVLDRDGENQLVELPVRLDGAPFVALKLRCTSTGRLYVLRVHPDETSARAALARSFGYDNPDEYQLEAQT
jgi:hypothetical protein